MPINYKKCTTEQEKTHCKQITETFFSYYAYNNLYNECNHEFCDALVIFENYNLIFQMKSTANQNQESYMRNLKKGTDQLKINEEQMKDISNLKLYIGTGTEKKEFHNNFGKKTFYILIMDGMSDYFEKEDDFMTLKYPPLFSSNAPDNLEQSKLYKEYFIYHTKEEFENTLKYTSTIKDYIDYLEFSADVIHNRKPEVRLLCKNKYNLLHLFLTKVSNKHLIDSIKENHAIIAEDLDLNHQDIISILEQNKESYLIDNLITNLMNSKCDENITRDLVSLRRACRIDLAKAINCNINSIFKNNSDDIVYIVDYQYYTTKLYEKMTLENYVNNYYLSKCRDIGSYKRMYVIPCSGDGIEMDKIIKIDCKRSST